MQYRNLERNFYFVQVVTTKGLKKLVDQLLEEVAIWLAVTITKVATMLLAGQLEVELVDLIKIPRK